MKNLKLWNQNGQKLMKKLSETDIIQRKVKAKLNLRLAEMKTYNNPN